MGFLIAAVLFLGGGLLILDGIMMAGSVSNIMQQDYVQTRLVGGATVLALGSILWVLCSISETLTKAAKSSASAPSSSPAPVLRPLDQRAGNVPAPGPQVRPAATSGWTCKECGKVNAPMSPVCPCGNLRG